LPCAILGRPFETPTLMGRLPLMHAMGNGKDQRADETAADPAARLPDEQDTLASSHALSRQSTDFGIGDGIEMPQRSDPLLGLDLGDAVIESVLASGGMGRVYVARQRSPNREVAVKVIRQGHRSPAAVRRFRREADLLGRLRHPGIAQVFMAGCLDLDGEETPYFLMELIPGAETLIRAVDRRQLSIRQRLTLFGEICRAVGHGHAAGIVHRDLKPGNILVDAEGRPKVIDFGIARLDQPEGEATTETVGFLGTRQYSSPEQCEGLPVDARSDVYSLGVILSELLTGRLPYDVKSKSLVETARIVRETPPARLRLGDSPLAGGVNAIAAMCLAKRPHQRYRDATSLAMDIERLLAGEPLQARQPPALERLSGWLDRQRTSVASIVAAIVSAAVVAAATIMFQSNRPPPAAGNLPTAGPGGPTATFPNISSRRTTPLQWIGISVDRPLQGLSVNDFRLRRNGVPLPLNGLTIAGNRQRWELRGLEKLTAQEGSYLLELIGTDTTPVDLSGRRLTGTPQATWQMPPYREIAFSLLDDDWQQYVVAQDGVELYTEQSAGATTFFRPTTLGKEGTVVLRFPAPFVIAAATLTAPIAVWTTGDPFPYDPGAKAALDVSPDGEGWTTLDTRQANRGGFGKETFDIRKVVAGSRDIWVRARLTATREWPGDGPIFAQFLRTNPAKPDSPFRLTLTGETEGLQPPPPGILPADN